MGLKNYKTRLKKHERKNKVITKVSYRPYVSGVNNRQKQPQNVNFKAQLNPKMVQDATTIYGLLTTAYSIGKFHAQDMFLTLIRGGSEILKESGAVKLAEGLEKGIGNSTDSQIIGQVNQRILKHESQTFFDSLSESYLAGLYQDPSQMPEIVTKTGRIIQQQEGEGSDVAAASKFVAENIDLGVMLQLSNLKILQEMNPQAYGIFSEFVRALQGD